MAASHKCRQLMAKEDGIKNCSPHSVFAPCAKTSMRSADRWSIRLMAAYGISPEPTSAMHPKTDVARGAVAESLSSV